MSSKSASLEYINQTKKSDFMARSNPIGLAEPKVVNCTAIVMSTR